MFKKFLSAFTQSVVSFIGLDGFGVAAALSFFSLLSVIPLMMLCLISFKIGGGADYFSSVLVPIILDNLAPDSSRMVVEAVKDVFLKLSGKTLGVVSLLFLFWVSTSLFFSFNRVVSRIWKVDHSTFFSIKQVIKFWIFFFLIPVAFSVLIGYLIPFIPLGRLFLGSELFAIIVIFSFFYLLLMSGGKHVGKRRIAFFTAIFLTLSWFIVKWVFSHFTVLFINYNKIYGSLAALPLFLLWLFCFWFIIVFGLVFSNEMSKALNKL